MPQKISRRDFAKKAAGVAAGLTISKRIMAQNTQEKQPEVTGAEMEAVQKQLAKPLPEAAHSILKADLASQKNDTANRLKVKLPENSEPCFIFVPTPRAKKEQDQ